LNKLARSKTRTVITALQSRELADGLIVVRSQIVHDERESGV